MANLWPTYGHLWPPWGKIIAILGYIKLCAYKSEKANIKMILAFSYILLVSLVLLYPLSWPTYGHLWPKHSAHLCSYGHYSSLIFTPAAVVMRSLLPGLCMRLRAITTPWLSSQRLNETNPGELLCTFLMRL